MVEDALEPCGIALIGCAHPHSGWHLATLKLIPEVERIFLWDADRSCAEALAPEAGSRLGEIAGDLPSLLARDDLHAVLIALPNDAIPTAILQAAEAGKHVLAEKPAATSPPALLPALAAARAAGVTLGVLYPWRAHPASREIRRLIQAGILGQPLAVEARMVTSQVRFRDPGHWLFQRSRSGGGILPWLGSHFLDLLRFLLQDEVESVAATVATLSGELIDVEDTAALSLRFAGGALGTFQAGYLLPRSTAGYRGAAYDTAILVRGDAGHFTWHPTAREQVVRVESIHPAWAGAPERELRFSLEPCEAFGGRHGLEFVRRFLRAAQAGAPPPATGTDALRVLEICAAAYHSSESGRRVPVEQALRSG